MLYNVLFIFGAYILGSLPVLYGIGRLRGYDLRLEYDMHLALWRKVGFKWGFIGIVWDMLKGMAPPLLALLLDMDIIVVVLSGLAVVIGQMWPIFIRYSKGEKGNTTGIAAAFIISPPALGLALIPIIVGGLLKLSGSLKMIDKPVKQRFKFSGASDSMPLGMIIGFILLPLMAWMLKEPSAVIWSFTALTLLIVVRRLTSALLADLKADPDARKLSVIRNRFLFDRSNY